MNILEIRANEITTHMCSNCRQIVQGVNGRWTCTNCGTSGELIKNETHRSN